MYTYIYVYKTTYAIYTRISLYIYIYILHTYYIIYFGSVGQQQTWQKFRTRKLGPLDISGRSQRWHWPLPAWTFSRYGDIMGG